MGLAQHLDVIDLGPTQARRGNRINRSRTKLGCELCRRGHVELPITGCVAWPKWGAVWGESEPWTNWDKSRGSLEFQCIDTDRPRRG